MTSHVQGSKLTRHRTNMRTKGASSPGTSLRAFLLKLCRLALISVCGDQQFVLGESRVMDANGQPDSLHLAWLNERHVQTDSFQSIPKQDLCLPHCTTSPSVFPCLSNSHSHLSASGTVFSFFTKQYGKGTRRPEAHGTPLASHLGIKDEFLAD